MKKQKLYLGAGKDAPLVSVHEIVQFNECVVQTMHGNLLLLGSILNLTDSYYYKYLNAIKMDKVEVSLFYPCFFPIIFELFRLQKFIISSIFVFFFISLYIYLVVLGCLHESSCPHTSPFSEG